MYFCSVFTQTIRQGDMTDNNHKAETTALVEPDLQFGFRFDQIVMCLETEIFSGGHQQTLVVCPAAFDIHAGVFGCQLVRHYFLTGDAHSLQDVAESEDGAAGFLQGTVVLL